MSDSQVVKVVLKVDVVMVVMVVGLQEVVVVEVKKVRLEEKTSVILQKV